MDELEKKQNEEQKTEVVDTEVPLDKNLRLMSPGMMVIRRFFRSRLSIIGLIMVVGLFLFSFVGPLLLSELPTMVEIGGVERPMFTANNGKWGETELDDSGKVVIGVPVKIEYEVDGVKYTITQILDKQMERYSMFLGRKKQYCENDYTTKCNLLIQCNPYQITNGIFHTTRRKFFTICMEMQKTQITKAILI